MIRDRLLRVAILAPHFSEYATRLAAALRSRAEILLITEARNFESECDGLSICEDGPQLSHRRYLADYALRRISYRGFREGRRVRQAISTFRPDILHIQEQGDHFTAALGEEFAADCPIVLTVHDPIAHSGNDALVAKRFAAGLARLRAAASAFHVHGAHCERLLRHAGGAGKPIVATAHGVILLPVGGGVAGAGSRYLFFGRMEAYKGLETLLDAIDLLPVAFGPKFVLAGRGPELDRHRTRIASHPAIEVVDGFLSPVEAIRQFQRARAVIVPYHDATQSGVVSAAFGNGRPVIASRVGGLGDAVTDGANGLLVEARDPPSLASAILSMADDATCRRLEAGAQAAARGRFAWSEIASRLHALYADLLGTRGPVRP